VAAAVLVVALVVLRPWAPSTGVVAGPAPSTSAPPATSPAAEPTASDPPTTPTATAEPTQSADGRTPPIVAHRGGLEVHQFETQQAMEAAALAGFSVETDVRYTADGVAVLVHDEEAAKGLDCGGRTFRVSETTWAKLRDNCRSKPIAADRKSYPVPRFDATMEGIAAANPDVWVFPEIKTEQTRAQVKSYLDVLTKHGLRDRAVATSFERGELAKIRKEDPSMPTMLLVSKSQVPAADLAKDKLWGVGVERTIATKAYLRDLRKLDVQIMIWVLNDPREWAEARELAPDMVMTGYPAKYQAWLASK